MVKRKVKPMVKRKVKPMVKRKVKPMVKRKVKPMVKRKVKALLPIEFRIKYCRIHPGIGIARLGNSHTDYFLGPEVFGYGPQPKDGLFKDSEGMVKRQAVRFRIYAYDSNDRVVKEITSNDASVTWKVHIWPIERAQVMNFKAFSILYLLKNEIQILKEKNGKEPLS